MFGFERFNRHAGLVDRMAETLGVDIAEAVQRGELPPEELRRSVFNCMGCREAESCAHWLDEHAAGAEATPGYCRNDALFRALGG